MRTEVISIETDCLAYTGAVTMCCQIVVAAIWTAGHSRRSSSWSYRGPIAEVSPYR